MPVIKVNDQQYALRPGQTRLGGSNADVPLDGDATMGIQAIVEVGAEDQVVIRRADTDSVVRVNGVALGVEPTPLMHGDKVEIAGQEILYSDDSKGGATQYVSTDDVAALVQKRTGPSRATASTGGRLVSLVDGKEYTIPDTGITIGRDASADVVVAESEVSRKHAEITPAANGYEVKDHSANGLLVNGARVHDVHLLARADVIRIGSEEFRFYADPVPLAAPATPAAAPTPVAPVATSAAPAGSQSGAHTARPVVPPRAAGPARVSNPPVAPHVAPPPAPVAPAPVAEAPAAAPPTADAPPADSRPVIAALEVTNEGITKGRIYEVRTLLAHIGRGAHNDVMIADDSVSDTHAKLQRRDDGWYVVDVGSTNGTYVGGSRITAEKRLEGAPDLRFGGVKTVFRALDAGVDLGKGTRAIASYDRTRLPTPAAAPATIAAAASSPATAVSKPGIPTWAWLVVLLAVAGVGAYLVLSR